MDVLGFNQLGQVLLGAAHVCGQAGITISGDYSIVDSEPKFGFFCIWRSASPKHH